MVAVGMDALKSNIDRYVCNVNEAVHFKVIRNVEDIENDSIVFHPDMSHQIFGYKEQVFGYHKLRINIYYTASKLHCFIELKYSEKLDPEKHCEVKADNVVETMKEVIPPGCTWNMDQFSHLIRSDASFVPHGEIVHQYKRTYKDGSEHLFEMYNPCISRYPGFREYHDRMQTLIMWFIDAATYIDPDDEKWEYYTIYEKVSDDTGKHLYYFVGYCTVYNFYAYPEHCRPRIAQFLVIPPYQRQGHATETVDIIQKRFLSRSNIRDICVEDPSENFQRIRDYVDCKNCIALNLDCFSQAKLMNGYDPEMYRQCNKKLKLNKSQSRRVYEIIRLTHTNILDEKSFKPYRLEVKRRLNRPFTSKGYRMNLKTLILSDEERCKVLENEFQELLQSYLSVVQRLKKDEI